MTYLGVMENLDGFAVKELPSIRFPTKDPKDPIVHLTILCPVCQGYGGWNLELNAYGEGKHFRASCSQCGGWGWVNEADSLCIHVWGEAMNVGRCLNNYACVKCGIVKTVDSSD